MIQSLKLAIETSTERVFEVTASHKDSVVRLQLIIGLIRFWSFAKMNAQSIFFAITENESYINTVRSE